LEEVREKSVVDVGVATNLFEEIKSMPLDDIRCNEDLEEVGKYDQTLTDQVPGKPLGIEHR